MKYIVSLTVFVLFLFGCELDPGETGALQKQETAALNPNGDSELALLMRAMADEFTAVKKVIEEGGEIGHISDFKSIYTAIPTKESMKDNGFQAFAQAFLQSVDELENSEKTQRSEAYKGVVNACMNCHEASCHGPMRRIEKMYIPEFVGE